MRAGGARYRERAQQQHPDRAEDAHVALAREVRSDEAGMHGVGGHIRVAPPIGQLAREQDVRELGRAVHAEALIPAVGPFEIVEVEAVARERVPGGGDVHDAPAGALEGLVAAERVSRKWLRWFTWSWVSCPSSVSVRERSTAPALFTSTSS